MIPVRGGIRVSRSDPRDGELPPTLSTSDVTRSATTGSTSASSRPNTSTSITTPRKKRPRATLRGWPNAGTRASRAFSSTHLLHRQPLVLYASHPHFAQTNVTPAVPGEGTGGLTERNKTRIVMPFAAGLDATDHVLGHEIAHAFQIDIVKRAGRDAFTLPGWFIEGMAEYLSVGPEDSHTAMWLRDAAAHRRLPTVEQLNQPRYFLTDTARRSGRILPAAMATTCWRECCAPRCATRSERLEEISGVDRDSSPPNGTNR